MKGDAILYGRDETLFQPMPRLFETFGMKSLSPLTAFDGYLVASQDINGAWEFEAVTSLLPYARQIARDCGRMAHVTIILDCKSGVEWDYRL